MKPSPLILAAAVLLAAQTAHADSLFPGSSTAVKTSAASSSLYSDFKARQVGDLLTILINETASATSQAETKTSNSDNLNYGPGFGPLLHLIKNFGVSGNDSSDGSGSTNRSDTLTAEITVRVKQVLPNGSLEVEGTRQVGMNAETQMITLSGVVRPQDITYSNTVPSSLVADAQIKYSGKGPVGNQQHEGLVSRLFKFLF
jgi:flagellar L-ring protein precursor FlgH